MQEYIIHTNENPILRKKSKPVFGITSKEKELFLEMERLMRREKGIGLAAPQIGISLQMIIAETQYGIMQFANPRILKRNGGLCAAEEGCLSLPGINVEVRRAKSVIIEAINIEGKKIKLEAENLLARVLQHEIDHLQGCLIIDYLPWHKRLINNIKLSKESVLKQT